MFGVNKRLPEYEFSDLMNDWLDPATREEVERSARRRTPLQDPEHAALATEYAARRVAGFWWLVPVMILQTVLVSARLIVDHPDERTSWDVASAVLMLSMLVFASAYTFTYVRAFRFHRTEADYEALETRARERRSGT